MAIAAIITPFFFAPFGILVGHLALREIGKSGGGGRALAKAGIILSYLVSGLFVAFVVFAFAIFPHLAG